VGRARLHVLRCGVVCYAATDSEEHAARGCNAPCCAVVESWLNRDMLCCAATDSERPALRCHPQVLVTPPAMLALPLRRLGPRGHTCLQLWCPADRGAHVWPPPWLRHQPPARAGPALAAEQRQVLSGSCGLGLGHLREAGSYPWLRARHSAGGLLLGCRCRSRCRCSLLPWLAPAVG
jgi:hypothetical protein